MASFRKRGPHQWQAQVRKRGHSLQTRTFETRSQAERWARAIEVEMDKGSFVSRAEAEATTLKELLECYLADVHGELILKPPLATRTTHGSEFASGSGGALLVCWRVRR